MLDIVFVRSRRANGKVKDYGEQLTFTKDVKHTAVFTCLALTVTAAELVIRTVDALTAGVAYTNFAVKGAAIGRIAAACVLVPVISVCRMIEKDNAGDFLYELGVITVFAGNLKSG